MVGAKVRKRWRATALVRRRTVTTGCPVCRGRDDASCLLRCLLHSVRRRNQLSAVDARGHLHRDQVHPPGLAMAGRGGHRATRSEELCISTLHMSLKIRVLPRAESATGCMVRPRRWERGRIRVRGRYFRSVRRALRGSARLAEGLKATGTEVKHRTCRFFSGFSTRRWWRFQAIR
jgi:hypothetical protein